MIVDSWVRGQPVRLAPVPRSRQVLPFHAKLPGYRETPLVRMDALAERLGVHSVHVKYELSRLGLPSFKILGVSWAVYRTLARLLDRPVEELTRDWEDVEGLRRLVAGLAPLTLVAATDGNHGRAVARMAALLGFDAHIYVPAGTAMARIVAIRAEGARIDVVQGDYDMTVDVAARTATPGRIIIADTSWAGYHEVPRWVSAGYGTIFDELAQQLAAAGSGQPTMAFVPVGVGALALTALRRLVPQGTAVVGVEPVGADCVTRSLASDQVTTVPGPHHSIMAGLNCGTPSPVAWPTVRASMTASLVVDDESVERAMCLLAAAGIAAGETGAATTAALLSVAESPQGLSLLPGLGPQARVLLLCTEAATDPVKFADVVGAEPGEVLARRPPQLDQVSRA